MYILGGNAMATHMIPRNTRGEGRILFIFSTKALIYTAVGAGIGFPLYWIMRTLVRYRMMTTALPGMIIMAVLALIGFAIGTFKIPDGSAFKFTRLVGGENIDDVILRYIRFKRKKNKIYITKDEEVVKNDE